MQLSHKSEIGHRSLVDQRYFCPLERDFTLAITIDHSRLQSTNYKDGILKLLTFSLSMNDMCSAEEGTRDELDGRMLIR